MMPSWMTPDQHGKGLYADYLFNAITGNWEWKRPVWVMLMANSLTKGDIKSRGVPVLDLYLAQEAKRLRKQTGAVEKVEEQCNLLNGLNFSQRKDQKPVVTAHPLCRLGSGSARPGSSGTGSWVCRAPTVAAPPASAQKFLPAGRGTTKVPEEAEAAAAEAAALAVQRPVSPTGGELQVPVLDRRISAELRLPRPGQSPHSQMVVSSACLSVWTPMLWVLVLAFQTETTLL
ncbi:metalloprotease TIKI1 isoform X4 [Delphinapterus leucas]|uniref:Metalloprotease TIKI n=1 Tax=Delphinapterus leucas TaxID=9749 RepID=A0A7F8KH73_DELLE|nr:metalloprotease TIKI1 isoform X4 [Delphinapterus leucas]